MYYTVMIFWNVQCVGKAVCQYVAQLVVPITYTISNLNVGQAHAFVDIETGEPRLITIKQYNLVQRGREIFFFLMEHF